jgi:hypothetical protein
MTFPPAAMPSSNAPRRSVLLVSLRVQTYERTGDCEVLAGTEVELTGVTDGDDILCVLRNGREVWIDRRYLD